MTKVFIIAEAGVNHNGSIVSAKKLIDGAVKAGADAVKFQTFKAKKVVSKYSYKAEYQKKNTDENESQLQMLKKLELDKEAHRELMSYCDEKDIIFISAPFDLESIDLLSNLGLEIFKIPSGEITNLPYLQKIGRLNKKIILSTGMSDLDEIRSALGILINAGMQKENITVLQCNTAYPTPVEDANLLAMCTIKRTLGINVGYSDHTIGIEIPIAAAALGAVIIEKHFTLDKRMEGPDHKASLSLAELKNMVKGIRKVEKALGNGEKKVSVSESKNKLVVRKSIVAAKDTKKGELFTEENITIKRPATGVSPMEWGNVIGKIAKRHFNVDEVIEL